MRTTEQMMVQEVIQNPILPGRNAFVVEMQDNLRSPNVTFDQPVLQ